MELLLFAAAGLVLGGMLLGPPGSLFGLLVAVLAGIVRRLHERVRRLEAMAAAAAPETRSEPESPAGARGATAAAPPRTPETRRAGQAPIPRISWTVPRQEAETSTPAAGSGLAAGLAALSGRLRSLLLGGNALVRVGGLLLLIGVAFLARYLADRGLVPPGVRLAGIAGAGVAVLGLGFRLRARPGAYGLVLQGVGVAILYLSLFAGMRLYELYDGSVAFPALVVIAVLAAALAVIQNALPLALFATAGGFAAPLVTSEGGADFVALLCYYAVLDLGVLGIARFRAWRSLNWVSFTFTAALGVLWALTSYRDEDRLAAQLLLVFFFLLFVAIPVLFTRTTARLTGVGGVLDGSLIFGMPVIAFSLQAALVEDTRFGVALSALAAAAVYAGLARWLWRQGGAMQRLLVESEIALAVVFATLAIPFAVDDGQVTGAAWALEGAGLVWLARRQGRRLPEFAGIALQGLAACAWLLGTLGSRAGAVPFLNAPVLSALMLSVGAVASALLLERARIDGAGQRTIRVLLLGWGAFVWIGIGWHEAQEQFRATLAPSVQALWLAGAALACRPLLGRWRGPGWLLCGAFPLLAALALFSLGAGLPGAGLWAEPVALGWVVAWLVLLWSLTAVPELAGRERARSVAHGTAGVLGGLLPAWALASWLGEGASAPAWSLAQWGVVPALYAHLLARRPAGSLPARLDPAGWNGSLVVLGGWLAVWTLASAFTAGASRPLPWLPLLNPLELGGWLVLVVIAGLPGRLHLPAVVRGATPKLVAGIGFVLLSTMTVRWAARYQELAWQREVLLRSDVVQTSLALVWTLLACAAMVSGHRRGQRGVWLVGAALLAVVVLKLFVVDLAGSGALPRIVSFIGVGVLVLGIGYLNPPPPKEEAA